MKAIHVCNFAVFCQRIIQGKANCSASPLAQKIRHYGLLNRYDQAKHAAIVEKYKGGSIDLAKNDKTGIATLLINNPKKKNALSGKMMVDLYNHINDLEQWKAGKGVVLAGVGGTFCSGGDLDMMREFDKSYAEAMSLFMHTITTRLFNLPLVSLAAIDGHALGGGAELTTACDFRVMSSRAKVGFVQVRLNIAPGWGAGTRLVRLIGRTKSLHLLVSGSLLNANKALEYGFASDIITESDDFVYQGQQWLLQNCVGNVDSINALKTVVAVASIKDLESSLETEREQFCKVWGSSSHREAVDKNIKHQ